MFLFLCCAALTAPLPYTSTKGKKGERIQNGDLPRTVLFDMTNEPTAAGKSKEDKADLQANSIISAPVTDVPEASSKQVPCTEGDIERAAQGSPDSKIPNEITPDSPLAQPLKAKPRKSYELGLVSSTLAEESDSVETKGQSSHGLGVTQSSCQDGVIETGSAVPPTPAVSSASIADPDNGKPSLQCPCDSEHLRPHPLMQPIVQACSKKSDPRSFFAMFCSLPHCKIPGQPHCDRWPSLRPSKVRPSQVSSCFGSTRAAAADPCATHPLPTSSLHISDAAHRLDHAQST